MLLLSLTSSAPIDNKWKNEAINEQTFLHPDRHYYPETWFHFIGGNVSKEGITADLEAIAAAKISGIQLFHGQFGGPWPGVSPQIACLSDSWDDLIAWTASECKRLNLQFTMQNCPGWSYAGGPWIEPSNAMRHLVQSRTDVVGGKAIHTRLEKPQPSNEDWRDYQDLFVLAFPTPEGDTGKPLVPIAVKSSLQDANWLACITGQKQIKIAPSPNQPIHIDVDFGKETLVRTVELPSINSFSHGWVYRPGITVTVYADLAGKLTKIAYLDLPQANWEDDQPITIACKETTARKYRIDISNKHDMVLSYINFYSGAHQQNWESEAGWTLRSIVREKYPEQSKKSWVAENNVMNITDKLGKDGVLTWNAPKGNWTVLRIGHVNSGMKNGPAPAEATGWESNKLDVAGVRANFDGYIGRLLNKDHVLDKHALNGILLDSWECRTQTWTAGLDKIFDEKQGYALLSKMPALFGYVVDQPETTAKFLRDWRVTLNDLLVKNFFGEMGDIAHRNGLKVSFETASGDVFPGDILEYFKYADVPMCEFWQPSDDSYVGSMDFKPIKPTVSAARVYGKKRVAAESFTSFALTWDEQPRFLKTFADRALANGVSHLVFHTYTHNPRTDFLPPGSSFGSGIGTPFLRLQTWWPYMSSFTDYLARCGYMLESGRPVSDVLLYLGDEQNHKPSQLLPFPKGYTYDYANADVLLNRLSVENGRIVTPEGIAYRMLWLYDCERMLPETLEKIYSMVEQGAIVLGNAPTTIATLRGGKDAEDRFQKAVRNLWGANKESVRSIGKGKVYRTAVKDALDGESIKPDFMTSDTTLQWLHRQTADADIYFLSTANHQAFNGTVSFRSEGYAEIWDPITGEVTNKSNDKLSSSTPISFHIPQGGAQFVVFRKQYQQRKHTLEQQTNEKRLNTPWEVRFSKGWGIEHPIKLDRLIPWKDMKLSQAGKSFSGSATYKTTFTLDQEKGNSYVLDLGDVEVIASVKLNGKQVGTRWTYPYQVDISDYLQPGNNELEVTVASTWFNRLVYDAGLPEEQRKTWTINGPDKDAPLKAYGMLGPVVIRSFN
ncbi:hypothetical protein GCM10023231_31420 [Olivibacter ginsenosidimutans]|uniref:Beta-mannosidase-like galactose-binding domain-containing protein n=1 Tax=Olivibacter ginsenosidimutans TaxID=1176537 RepID=A0ABP9BTN7_9SPHI